MPLLDNKNLIKDLIIFYITENYNEYLKNNNIDIIPDDELHEVISNMYDEKKDHLQKFLKDSLKTIMEGDYMGDGAVSTLCLEIFEDDEYCKKRLVLEIKEKQEL